jgi:hypothetical protein
MQPVSEMLGLIRNVPCTDAQTDNSANSKEGKPHPGTLPSSGNQCILGKGYLKSNLPRLQQRRGVPLVHNMLHAQTEEE